MGVGDWIHRSRELRRELAVLDSGAASEDEQREAYAQALRRELSGWLQVQKHGQELGLRHEAMYGSGPDGAPLVSPKSGLQMAEEAEETIAAIEREIERVSSG